jgi:hypothetical protein
VSFSSRPWFCFQKDWQLVDKPSRQTTLEALLSAYTLRLHVSFGSWFPSSIHELACFLFLWTWVIFQPAEEEDIAQRELSLSLSPQCPFSFFGPFSVWVFSQIMCWELWALWWIGCHGRERERECFSTFTKAAYPISALARLRERVMMMIISKDSLPKDLYLLLRISLSVDRASNPVTKSATAHDTQAHTRTKKGVDRFPSTTCQATWSSRRRLPTCRFCVTAIWPP